MKKLLFILIILWSSINAQAQNVQFTASISSDTVYQDHYFELKYEVTSDTELDFKGPEFNHFEIVSGPNYQSSVTIINGKTKASKSVSFYLTPIETGHFQIPSATILVGDEEIKSNVLELEVISNPKLLPQPIIHKNSNFDNFFNFESPNLEDFFDRPEIEKPKKKKTVKL